MLGIVKINSVKLEITLLSQKKKKNGWDSSVYGVDETVF